jgi:hypothetical protein
MTPTDPLAADDAIVAEAGKRADAATPGPWEVRTVDGLYAIAAPHSWIMEGEHDDVEAPFIAAARTDIPALRAIADKRGRALREYARFFDNLSGVDIEPHAYTEMLKSLARIREILRGE